MLTSIIPLYLSYSPQFIICTVQTVIVSYKCRLKAECICWKKENKADKHVTGSEKRLILTAAKIVQLHRNGGIYIREVFKWRLIERKNGWKEVSLMEIVECEHMDQQAAKPPPCQSSG